MNIKLEYFTDRGLAALESAIDDAICSVVRHPIVDPAQMDHLVNIHRLTVEERIRRESVRRF